MKNEVGEDERGSTGASKEHASIYKLLKANRIKSKLVTKNEVSEVTSAIVKKESNDYDFYFSSAYHDAIVDEKGALETQLNNINIEIKNKTVSNNENVDDDNDAEGNNGDDKMAYDEPGAIDMEGSNDNELAEDVTADTGDETFSFANNDNSPADKEKYPDELNKANRDKRAKLGSCLFSNSLTAYRIEGRWNKHQFSEEEIIWGVIVIFRRGPKKNGREVLAHMKLIYAEFTRYALTSTTNEKVQKIVLSSYTGSTY
ncbi:hypothetical protein FF38_01025 [Lucilia cuprina]|uniref:Uncharacterized protein n=1 Tax=Lucilia cuprina TaxID=7375 RepID=A0A0L0CH85_LUCCU|nr:hypothetical protein FF38_01025 [Lucilia cuprina]